MPPRPLPVPRRVRFTPLLLTGGLVEDGEAFVADTPSQEVGLATRGAGGEERDRVVDERALVVIGREREQIIV